MPPTTRPATTTTPPSFALEGVPTRAAQYPRDPGLLRRLDAAGLEHLGQFGHVRFHRFGELFRRAAHRFLAQFEKPLTRLGFFQRPIGLLIEAPDDGIGRLGRRPEAE